MKLQTRERLRSGLSVGASNVAALGASLGALLVSARMVGRDDFAGYAVALALQALCFNAASAVGPLAGRTLAMDSSAQAVCHRWRWRSGALSSLLVLLSGVVHDRISIHPLGMPCWAGLAIQVVLSSVEGHRLQVLQMSGAFGTWSRVQPLTRLGRLLALALGWALGWQGVLAVVGLQTIGQIVAFLGMGAAAFPERNLRPLRFDWSWAGWNFLSGTVVWSATRANLVLSSSRLGPQDQSTYGLAETLSTSLMVLNQSVMTFLQPAIYRWNPRDGGGSLLRTALAVGSLGSIAALLAALAAPWALGVLLEPTWASVVHPLWVFCLGSALQAWSAVPAAVLHRLRRGRVILALESLGGVVMIASMLHVVPGSSASAAAWCWTLGRGVWALAALVVVTFAVRQELAKWGGSEPVEE